MFCEACQQREATVHLTQTFDEPVAGHEPGRTKQHFCQACADTYFASVPEMNSMRGLICLSDLYRSKLYDLLEAEHGEAFDNSTRAACQRGSELMQNFLRERLKKENIEINEDGFAMLCIDFFGSHHFYTRADEHKRKKG